jgi:MHS family shikimate/dehydroshikimate transporter-like MFS transporter
MSEKLQAAATPPVERSTVWRAAGAGFVGSLVEWYDYYIYGTAAALVFSKLFFTNADPTTGLIASFATFGVGFLARPLGGIVAGHFGDKVGRKRVLVITLMIMGLSTVGIGLLPGYEQIGIWAPILLVVLRLLQGFAVGGEWGGAAVMVVEYAPLKHRGFFGGLPQAGNVGGLLLATGVFAVVSLLPADQFEAWGWRVPFLLSFVLIFVGLYIRARIVETPAFRQIQDDSEEVQKLPVAAAFRGYWRTIVLATGAAATLFSASYVAITYVISYATTQAGLPAASVLSGVALAAAVAFIAWPAAAALSDRVGRKPVMLTGALLILLMAFPFFWLVDTGSLGLTWIAIVLLYGIAVGMIAGVLPAFFSELFDTSVRFTGVSIAYQVPAVLIGGFTPLIATWLVSVNDGNPWAVSVFLVAISALSLLCIALVREPRGADLDRVETDAARRARR